MLRFTDDRGTAIEVDPDAFVIMGYTGRDRAGVQHHVDELARQGIAPPPAIPMRYPVPVGLLTTAAEIRVTGARTCGEVEPMLIAADDVLYLGIGSDHTDRDVEREDIARSKAACPKPIGSQVQRLAALDDALDAIRLESRIDGAPYQAGTLAQIAPLASLLALARANDAHRCLVVSCGTVPLSGGAFRFGRRFEATLVGGPLRRPLALAYDVVVAAASPN